jgi:hypothetical protein
LRRRSTPSVRTWRSSLPHPGNQGLIPKWGLSHQELIDWLRDELEAAKEYAEEDLRGGEQ